MCNFMKQLLTILIIFFWAINVQADCAGSGLWAFPSGRTIKQNSIFILDGYAESQRVILGLNKQFNVYLKSGTKKIKLIVTEIYVGEYHLTQAILKPEIELDLEMEYTMCIDSLPKYERLRKHNSTKKESELVIYNVIEGIDTVSPQLKTKVKELKKSLIRFGCGPSIHVIFNNPAIDSSEIIVKTTVKNLRTGKTTSYLIKPNGNEIRVGHGMCSGAFDFKKGRSYMVEFSFVDASGNYTSYAEKTIKFKKPIMETRFNDE